MYVARVLSAIGHGHALARAYRAGKGTPRTCVAWVSPDRARANACGVGKGERVWRGHPGMQGGQGYIQNLERQLLRAKASAGTAKQARACPLIFS